jgi:hypothetical protein
VLWMTEQKPQCLSCEHVLLKWPAMRCGMSPVVNGRNMYSAHNYCIDAREQECVGGRLFEVNVEVRRLVNESTKERMQ